MKPQPKSEIILYQTEDNRTRIEVRLENETVWLTQKQMAELFQKDIRTINDHIQNLLEEGELVPESVIRKYRITAADGKSYETQHYNLDVVISVGYRVALRRRLASRVPRMSADLDMPRRRASLSTSRSNGSGNLSEIVITRPQ